MKKYLLSLLGIVAVLTINAQALNSFNYQAVVRDGSGVIQANLSVTIDIHFTENKTLTIRKELII